MLNAVRATDSLTRAVFSAVPLPEKPKKTFAAGRRAPRGRGFNPRRAVWTDTPSRIGTKTRSVMR